MTHEYQDYLAWTYFGEQALDKEEFVRLHELLHGVTRFIDVGASHGVYTYHANRILSNADIICIEADPQRFRILQENTSKWAAESTNRIQCVNAAASDETDRKGGPIEFFTTGTQISGGLFSVEERSDAYQPCTVPVVCIDDFFAEGARTFVKIDVEGAELRVLKGARRHIEAKSTSFFTEISWWGDRSRGTTTWDLLAFCCAFGLRIDRRLKSDYLISPEDDAAARRQALMRSIPPLVVRYGWSRFVPPTIRTWRERRENSRRLARFGEPLASRTQPTENRKCGA